MVGLLCELLSPLPRTPDWASSLPLLLQLHGLSCCVRSPGASTEAAPAGWLCLGCRTLPASAPAPHGPQALRQSSPLCAFGAGRGLRGSPVLLTHASLHTCVNSHGAPQPLPVQGYCRGGVGQGPRDLRNFCRGLKPELVESQGPRERSSYPRVQPLSRGG